MSARLRHSVSSDGESVAVAIHDGQTVPFVRTVPIAEARRFAWAVLSDVDPDEAAVTNAAPRKRPPQGFLAWAILIAVRDGLSNSGDIAERFESGRNTVSVILSQHRCAGYVALTKRRVGISGVWEITEVGAKAATGVEAMLRAAEARARIAEA